ncbi:hypothetical protein BP6252_09469 [Coleophoma cylindrospora]|uniref:Uncharacterized protein n=1 Tax=Coleophoma cylindrospora TaxID=1849047 RepID=A0A3D8R204_9HELO|nr:hypothetical protein BP6252_09469 [Coleophoma cylindrospora]
MSYPPGDNSSDALVGGEHYNLTTLLYWNYTYYSNQTISNGSSCLLIFPPYMPRLLSNGTFLNSTSCYSPILPLGKRSKIGIGFSVFFLFSLILTLVNFNKSNQPIHPPAKGLLAARRRQCFWLLLTNACGLVAGIVGVDVDRYYLSELPLVLYNVLWLLAVLTTLACVWESLWLWSCLHENLDGAGNTSQGYNDWWAKIMVPLRWSFYMCLCI